MMKTVKRKDGYWITGVPNCSDCGPYDDREEADGDREGMQNTLDNWLIHDYWTTEPENE